MRKLSVKEIIDFRGKSERSKKNFAGNIKFEKAQIESDGGGDYWVSCLSAISSSYRYNKSQIIIDRKNELEEKHEESSNNRTKNMYSRNIYVLNKYIDTDFRKWKPLKQLKFEKKQNVNSTLLIKGIEIKSKPQHVFTYTKNDINEVGAIWFIAKLGGFEKNELGIFTDILYRYLKANFSKDHQINSNYCIAVDLYNNTSVTYLQLERGEVTALLSSTLEEIRKLM